MVSTILKNISQWEGLSHILWKNKKCSKPPTRISFSKITFPSQGRLLPRTRPPSTGGLRGDTAPAAGKSWKKSCNHWGNARKPEKILEILGKFINGGLSWENHGEIQEKMRIFMGKSSIGLLCRLPTGKAPWKSTGNHRPSYVKSLACRPRVIWGSQ